MYKVKGAEFGFTQAHTLEIVKTLISTFKHKFLLTKLFVCAIIEN